MSAAENTASRYITRSRNVKTAVRAWCATAMCAAALTALFGM